MIRFASSECQCWGAILFYILDFLYIVNESRKTADSSDVLTPIVLELKTFESWQLRFGKHENRVQFRSPHLPLRLCYCDRTCTKMTFTLCNHVYIVGDTPYSFGAMQHQSQLWLKKIKLWVKLNHLFVLNEEDYSNETFTIHVLSDGIYFVGNIPYIFGAMWLWVNHVCTISKCCQPQM